MKAKVTRVRSQPLIIKILNINVTNVKRSSKDFKLNYVFQGTLKDNMK